jgi:glucose-6-phosphate-specific signal transduction histidine kinase
VHLRELPSRRFEALVESTAYFLAAEALRDAGTPPAADEISLLVADRGDRLEVELQCAAGGTPREPGATVRGFRDRVAALGGSLDTDPGSVRAELPVAR